MQRRFANATRNAGLVVTRLRAGVDEPGALAGRLRPARDEPPAWDAPRSGRPRAGARPSGGRWAPRSTTAGTSPSLRASRTSASKIRATSSGGVCWVIRPHMACMFASSAGRAHRILARRAVGPRRYSACTRSRHTGAMAQPTCHGRDDPPSPTVRGHRRGAAAAGHRRHRDARLLRPSSPSPGRARSSRRSRTTSWRAAPS